MLNVIMLSVIMLNVVMQSAVVPNRFQLIFDLTIVLSLNIMS